MKITFILPHAGLSGGIKVVSIYAEILKNRGHTVNVISTPRRSLSIKQKIKLFLTRGKWVFHTKNEKSFFDDKTVNHIIIDKYRDITDNDVPNADIVIATFWITAYWVNKLSPSKGVKVYFIQGKEAEFPNIPHNLVKKTYSFPLDKITISQSLKEWIKNFDRNSNIFVVKNSVDTNQFHATFRNMRSEPSIGFMYSDSWIKGSDLIADVLREIQDTFKYLRIYSYGSCDIDKSLFMGLNIEHTTQPEQSRIRDIYEKCDVWLCGSRMEGFHLPPLEAMACRCPVVSTAVGGPLDIVQDGINGFIAPIDDKNKLVELAVRILSLSNAEWIKMSNQAYRTAIIYTWDDAAELLENHLTDLLVQK
nr:glycosyltransferase family 4 protein [uncultured Desulfobulbus sp.]